MIFKGYFQPKPFYEKCGILLTSFLPKNAIDILFLLYILILNGLAKDTINAVLLFESTIYNGKKIGSTKNFDTNRLKESSKNELLKTHEI